MNAFCAATPGFEEVVKEEWINNTTVAAWRLWAEKLAIHTRPLTDAVIAHAELKPNMQVLDIASGAGEPSISIAKLLTQGGRVVATDISKGMLDIARDNAQIQGVENIDFQTADVHALPFDDNQFDCVVSRLGMMYFWDVETALQEVRRVLKPGGTVSFVTWGATEKNRFLASIIEPFAKRKSMPPMPEDAPTPMRFGDITKITGAFEKAGFSDAVAREYQQPFHWPGTPMDLFQHVYSVAVPLQPYFDSFEESERISALQEVEEELLKVYDGSFTNALGAFNGISVTK